jgi:hypothetical protein
MMPVKFPEGNCIRSIHNLPRDYFNGRMVLVKGKGPSHKVDADGAVVLMANPNPEHQDYDIAVATDSLWWETKENLKAVGDRKILVPAKSGNSPIPRQSNIFQVVLPEVMINGLAYSQVQTTNHFGHTIPAQGGAFLAVMAGLYLTSGKVMIVGVDLSSDYYMTQQEEKWRMCCMQWSMNGRTFIHTQNTGLLKDLLPVHYSIPPDSDTWVVIGAGPSKSDWPAIAMEHHASIAACNASIKAVSNPTIYMASDPDAIKRYGKLAESSSKYGTMVFIGEDAIRDDLPLWESKIRNIAVHAVRMALKRGAKTVWLCGCDGWSERELEYERLDGRKAKRHGSNENQAWALMTLSLLYPDAEIKFSRDCIVSRLVEQYRNEYKSPA